MYVDQIRASALKMNCQNDGKTKLPTKIFRSENGIHPVCNFADVNVFQKTQLDFFQAIFLVFSIIRNRAHN